jgi:hypothetical protein
MNEQARTDGDSGRRDGRTMRVNEGTVTFFEATCVAETEKALLIVCDEFTERKAWVPRKFIHHESHVKRKGQTGDLVFSKWFAAERGWITS